MFASAIWSLHAAGGDLFAAVFCGVVILHYAASYDRVRWLLER